MQAVTIASPRFHLWHPPPLGTSVIENHGQFLPMNKLFISGTPGGSLEGIDNPSNRWAGWDFAVLGTSTPTNFAARFLEHQLAVNEAYGLADTNYIALFQLAANFPKLMSNPGDAITGSYRALDRTLQATAGITAVSALFAPGGDDLLGEINAALTGAGVNPPDWALQDVESDRSRTYDACNTGTAGNWPGQLAQHGATVALPNLTSLGISGRPVLGHATPRTVTDLDSLLTWADTTTSWLAEGNLEAAKVYEQLSSEINDAAMATAIYQHVNAVWPATRCGNYDVTGYTNSAYGYRYHDTKLVQAVRAPCTSLWDVSCPVLYPPQACMEEDLATLLANGWGIFGSTPYEIAVNYATDKILGAARSSTTQVMWLRVPGIGITAAGSATWAREYDYFLHILQVALAQEKFTDFILWDWNGADTDYTLLASTVDTALSAASTAGYSPPARARPSKKPFTRRPWFRDYPRR